MQLLSNLLSTPAKSLIPFFFKSFKNPPLPHPKSTKLKFFLSNKLKICSTFLWLITFSLKTFYFSFLQNFFYI